VRRRTDATQDVTHLIEADFFEAELRHLRADPLTNFLQLSVHAWDGADVPHETDNVFAMLLDLLFNLLNCHMYLE
jgi:hypothetical protein